MLSLSKSEKHFLYIAVYVIHTFTFHHDTTQKALMAQNHYIDLNQLSSQKNQQNSNQFAAKIINLLISTNVLDTRILNVLII